ncbi:hypothetical protein [Pseudomonas capsici]|uniref:hypothetical protein n=1 Tax=Pseudomonas capsici TaxID=2810614 RepID=UPI0021F13E23|nr:hypothetical protein [Pseudomonas capsici]MCV4285889.1 hypothetical protein [Pseudomonas capsici]
MANQRNWWDDYPDADEASVSAQQPQPALQAKPMQSVQVQAPATKNWWDDYPDAEQANAPQTSRAQKPNPAPQSESSWYSEPFSDTKENQGAGTAAIRGVGDGITFGFQDEILAGLDATIQPLIPVPENGSAAPTWRERFDDNVASQRALLKAGQDQHPVTATAGSVVGGVVPALLSGGMSLPTSAAATAARQTTGRAMLQGAAIGAGYGGVYGLGTAEGDLGERIPGAVQGAALGAAVGGALPAVIGGAKAVRNTVLNPEVRAQAQLNRTLERDGITPEQFRTQFDDLAARHPDSAIPADAGGENVRGVVERLANTPGESRSTIVETLAQRQATQRTRVGDQARSLSGVNRSADTAIDETMAQRAREAGPLYAAAHAEEVPWSPQLESLMQRPAMQAAYRGAERRAANQGRTFDGQFAEIAPDGTVTAKSVPRTGDLDIIKQNLDSQIESLLASGARSEARDIMGIRNDLLTIMDASAPTYAQARAVFAGHTRYKDGVEHGAQIMKTNISPERWASDFARLNPSEQEAVRIGAISSIIGKIGNDAASMPDITKYLRSPNGRAKIAAILPDDAARQRWENTLNHEIEVSRLSGRALGNSSTARRQAEIDEANGVMSDLVAIGFSASTGTGMMHTLLRALPRAAGARINERSNRILANALTSKAGLDALNGVLPRAMVGREAPALAGIAGGQSGATQDERRRSQRQAEIQAAVSGYYQTQGAANLALRQARIRNEYEPYRPDGASAWAIRRKAN